MHRKATQPSSGQTRLGYAGLLSPPTAHHSCNAFRCCCCCPRRSRRRPRSGVGCCCSCFVFGTDDDDESPRILYAYLNYARKEAPASAPTPTLLPSHVLYIQYIYIYGAYINLYVCVCVGVRVYLYLYTLFACHGGWVEFYVHICTQLYPGQTVLVCLCLCVFVCVVVFRGTLQPQHAQHTHYTTMQSVCAFQLTQHSPITTTTTMRIATALSTPGTRAPNRPNPPPHSPPFNTANAAAD